MHVRAFMKLFFILWVSLTFFSGCSVKEYAPARSMLITFKSDALRFSDMGYVKKSKSGVMVELYSTGKLVERFILEEDVCTQKGCLSYAEFNKQFLHVNYPDEMLRHIFRGEPIFNKKGLIRTDDGFKQTITTTSYNVIYKVRHQNIYFKDKTNKILIKLREIP